MVAALPAIAALSAWGLRYVPRLLAVALAALTLGASFWLLLADRRGDLEGWLVVDSDAPWGPAVVAFPDFTGAFVWPALLCGLLVAGFALLWWRERQAAGEWRRAAAASRTSKALH
jgi:hypothetical protein